MWKSLLKSLKSSESYISMALGLLVVVVLGILLFNYFSGKNKISTSKPEETKTVEEETSTSPTLPTTHTVVEGENLWKISEKYFNSGYNWVDIAKENALINPNYLEVGQTLKIPNVSPILPATGITEIKEPPITEDTYTVAPGDNLWKIAVRAYGDGFQWIKIAQVNNLVNPNLIHTGNVLIIPR